MRKSQMIDRRRFLLGAAGGMLALPMLEAHTPRVAYGQSAAPPKRVVFVVHSNGRPVGGGFKKDGAPVEDAWAPLTKTGAFPATGDLSPLLAALGSNRNEIVTINGVDNLVRHACNDEDGHVSSTRTCMTCVPMSGAKGAGGPSIDYVAGLRLRASAAQRSALVFPAGPYAEEDAYEGVQLWGVNGTEPALINSNPAKALTNLFGSTAPTTPPATAKTLHDRLVARRGSMLDSVAKSYDALGKTVSASDRDKLAQHATFIRSLETRFGTTSGPISLAQGCGKPDASMIPSYKAEETSRGNIDGKITPFQIENLVMSLACDITRTATLHFPRFDDPTFQSEFSGASPLGGDQNWHGSVHGSDLLGNQNVAVLIQAYQYFGKMFNLLLTRLGQVKDADGSRLLDNTLVVWVSDLGYGAIHANWNVPVVLAGMKSAFSKGQGRHLQSERRSLGDLYAQVLRMVGGTDMTFGSTGTLGDLLKKQSMSGAAATDTAIDKAYVGSALKLHLGALDL